MPAPNPRLADRRPIDRRVRADLDVVFDDDVAVLRNLEMRAVRLLDEAEAVAADHRAVLHDDAMADDARARESRRARGRRSRRRCRAPGPMTAFG